MGTASYPMLRITRPHFMVETISPEMTLVDSSFGSCKNENLYIKKRRVTSSTVAFKRDLLPSHKKFLK